MLKTCISPNATLSCETICRTLNIYYVLFYPIIRNVFNCVYSIFLIGINKNTGVVEGNIVSAHMIFEITANQKVHNDVN